jgi:hypothetical protein
MDSGRFQDIARLPPVCVISRSIYRSSVRTIYIGFSSVRFLLFYVFDAFIARHPPGLCCFFAPMEITCEARELSITNMEIECVNHFCSAGIFIYHSPRCRQSFGLLSPDEGTEKKRKIKYSKSNYPIRPSAPPYQLSHAKNRVTEKLIKSQFTITFPRIGDVVPYAFASPLPSTHRLFSIQSFFG